MKSSYDVAMDVVKKISLDTWPAAHRDAAQKLMTLIDDGLFVGGCVRNTLLGEAVNDIDIATPLTPQEVTAKLKAANIKVIPTGLDHGTVTAMVDDIAFEITTLRHDVATDGRHADVAFTDNWLEDAKRRDFTINSLLMDMDGQIYASIDSAMDDLAARRIAFIGDAAARISEDHLRILRFFRFYASYGEGAPDATALAACADAAAQIKTLSRERITQELLKILAAPKATEVLSLMQSHKILDDVLHGYDAAIFERLVTLQNDYAAPHIMARLFVVAGNKARFFDEMLRLSHAQKKDMIKFDMAAKGGFYDDERTLKKAIYHHGNDVMLQGYLLRLAMKGAGIDAALMDIIQNWHAPDCPITGESLLAEGYVTGPDLGQELSRRQEEWLEGEVLS